MIKKKAFTVVRLIVGLLFVSASFSFPQAQARELKLGHNTSPLSPTHKASLKFAELVKQKTGGKVTVAVYPAAQLGKPADTLQALSMGSVDLFCGGLGFYARLEKDFNLHNVPFVQKDCAHLMRIYRSPVGQGMLEKVRKKTGIVSLSFTGCRPPRNLISKRPVRSVEDLVGLKIRVPGVKSYIEAWKTLGAIPTPIAWSETYLALGQGIVEAAEGALSNLYHSKFYEFAKYCTLIEYKPVSMVFAMSEKTFLSFPSEIQKSLKDSAEKAGEYLTELAREEVADVVKKMKDEGVTFIEVDVQAFIKKLEELPVRMEKEGNWSKGLYEKWRSIK